MTAEPSMEEILSSIKRIIAEEGDGAAPRARRGRAAPSPVPAVVDDDGEDDDGIFELSDPMPSTTAPGRASPPPTDRVVPPAPMTAASIPDPVVAAAPPVATSQPAAPPPVTMPADAAGPILSPHTAAASRGALDALSRMLVKPEPAGDGTLEGLVREMLRPMLREWLDANLPDLVETMVSREIAKISNAAA